MGGKESGPRQCSDHCQGFKQGMMYETHSPEPEMIINRGQGRVYERKGAALSLSVKFVTSSDLIRTMQPVKNEKENHP